MAKVEHKDFRELRDEQAAIRNQIFEHVSRSLGYASTSSLEAERRREIEHLTHVAIENWADLDFELLTPATKGELEQLLDRHLRIGQRIVDLEMEEKFGR
jgi:hypothetical protein